MIPRSELVEHCTLYLLNVCQWDHLIDHLSEQERRGADGGAARMELAALLAAVCRELVNKGNDRQMSRNLWNAGQSERAREGRTVEGDTADVGGCYLGRHSLDLCSSLGGLRRIGSCKHIYFPQI